MMENWIYTALLIAMLLLIGSVDPKNNQTIAEGYAQLVNDKEK